MSHFESSQMKKQHSSSSHENKRKHSHDDYSVDKHKKPFKEGFPDQRGSSKQSPEEKYEHCPFSKDSQKAKYSGHDEKYERYVRCNEKSLEKRERMTHSDYPDDEKHNIKREYEARTSSGGDSEKKHWGSYDEYSVEKHKMSMGSSFKEEFPDRSENSKHSPGGNDQHSPFSKDPQKDQYSGHDEKYERYVRCNDKSLEQRGRMTHSDDPDNEKHNIKQEYEAGTYSGGDSEKKHWGSYDEYSEEKHKMSMGSSFKEEFPDKSENSKRSPRGNDQHSPFSKDSQKDQYSGHDEKYERYLRHNDSSSGQRERMTDSNDSGDEKHNTKRRYKARTYSRDDNSSSEECDFSNNRFNSSSDFENRNDSDNDSSDDANEFDQMDGNDFNESAEGDSTDAKQVLQMNQRLREFDILDELEDSDQEGDEDHQPNSQSSDYDTEDGEEVALEDVDAMLEEGLPDKFKETEKKERVTLKRKVVLDEIGHDHFDLLPEGWIQVMHSSGMPVYLHQKSRVCTMARPYYLGPGSCRNHKIPLSAIPCLQYKRALEVEKKNKEEKEKNSAQNQNQPEIQLMAARIETSEENEAAQSLEALDLREYCKNLFNFKTITLIPFKSWGDRRKYVRMTKEMKRRQRPSLPGGTKLLLFPTKNSDGTNSRSKGEWIINPNGKSYVCILHEYVQHALKKHPKYQFKELENPATPYSATVFIGDMQYSVGMGASKKQAKVEAAKAALEVLIPEMKDKIERDGQFGMRAGIAQRSQSNDISIFDQIRVEDPRVAEFCAKTTEPPPYAILLTCLSRNLGLGEIKVHYEMNSKKHKGDEYTMVVGKHRATVVCKNKRDGKQRAAQAILQALHPNITHWGSLLRMYGNRSLKSVKEKKQEEQEITRLQSKASLNQPNFAILQKLRTEMLKLKEKRESLKAKGKFKPPENVVLPSLSSTDLNKINLS